MILFAIIKEDVHVGSDVSIYFNHIQQYYQNIKSSNIQVSVRRILKVKTIL